MIILWIKIHISLGGDHEYVFVIKWWTLNIYINNSFEKVLCWGSAKFFSQFCIEIFLFFNYFFFTYIIFQEYMVQIINVPVPIIFLKCKENVKHIGVLDTKIPFHLSDLIVIIDIENVFFVFFVFFFENYFVIKL